MAVAIPYIAPQDDMTMAVRAAVDQRPRRRFCFRVGTMELILLVAHLLIALVLIGVVLMQRSEGGGLGIGGGGGGGGGGMSGFMTGRGTANFLTRTTAILAALFMATSITLAILAGGGRESGSILDQPVGDTFVPPAAVEPDSAPAEEPAAPAEPSVPLQ